MMSNPFVPGAVPIINRAQRRKNAGINKRGEYKLKKGYSLLIYGTQKYEHFKQTIPLKDAWGNITGFKTITHTKLKK